MNDRDASQQPIPDRHHAKDREGKETFGPSNARPRPDGGKTKYDKPSEAADDFAIDELRDKPIRGNESPKE